MIRQQLRLARRSVTQIVRDPSAGRGFGRLLATRARGTMDLRLPWLPFTLIDDLRSEVHDRARVLEFGGGGSTLWFLEQGAEVVTVEHHPQWADHLRQVIGTPRWTLLERSLESDAAGYVGAADEFDDEHFDLVLVDGRERVRCAHASLSKVRPGGLLIFDDTDRDRYREGLTRIGWPRHDYVGFAPAKPTLAYTTLFRKPLGAGAP